MSTPHKTYEDSLIDAINELVSAMSALNMYPEALPWPDGEQRTVRYLSESDVWAKHAMEHMNTVFTAPYPAGGTWVAWFDSSELERVP